MKYKAYMEVKELEKMKPITTRWVVTEKGKGEKAWLSVRGFELNIYPHSDSLTESGETMKLFLTVCANQAFKHKSLEVTSAFLQGEKLDRDSSL